MKKLSPFLVLMLIVVVLGFGFVSISNKMVRSEETVKSNWAEVENQLQRRYDLIPNLVNTVKGYASHEEEIFTQIADARSKLAGASTVNETSEASQEIESALSRLLVVVENYPNLKADQTFRDLTYELAGTENRIATARGRYNDSVRDFNVMIKVFPNSIIASIKGLEEKELFEAVEGSSTPPVVDFSE